MLSHSLSSWYNSQYETSLSRRYITQQHIAPLLENLPKIFDVTQVGFSVEKKPIHTITFGNGDRKILMWSQMHGNESTTTKALFDLFRLLNTDSEIAKKILSNCTFCVIPILNPDGAEKYTRLNAAEIDLNRDAQTRSQPESRVLRNVFDAFSPDFCFNLHGQRTIFGVGASEKSAILSFLTPAEDAKRAVTPNRAKSMEIIAAINTMLQQLIPGHVARYDDGFNINCVGDTFQAEGIPTLLFEAGHFPEDYEREKTRELIFYALVEAIQYIATKTITGKNTADYFQILENQKSFYDIILKNVIVDDMPTDLGILYKEVLENGKIHFIPEIEDEKILKKSYGHKTIDFQNINLSSIRFQSFSLENDVQNFLKKFNKIDN